MKLKQETEKALKRFLKRKVAIALAVITGFLITGEVFAAEGRAGVLAAEGRAGVLAAEGRVGVLAAEGRAGVLAAEGRVGVLTAEGRVGVLTAEGRAMRAPTVTSQEELLFKIDVIKAEIEAQIAENERRLRELEGDQLNLIRQGDYFSKPVYPSTQVLLSSVAENAGTMKNRTADAFAHDLGIMEDYIVATLGAPPEPASVLGYKPFALSTTTSAGNMTGLTPELKEAYEEGTISLSELALLLLKQGNGAIAVGDPHSIDVDLGVRITLLQPEIPVVHKEVDVDVDAPSVPSVNVSTPSPNAPNFSAPTIVTPTIGAITPPVISLSVAAPDAVSPITVASVSPAAPAGISLTAPSVNVSVTPPVVTPNMSIPPVRPAAPAGFSIVISPQSPTAPATPATPPTVATPVSPTPATPNVITPPNIQYNAFGQTEYQGASVPGSYGLWMNNNETINATNAVIDITGGSHAGTMKMTSGSITTNVGSIATGATYSTSSSSTAGTFGPRTIISTTSKSTGLAMNVNVNGNYDIRLNSSDNCTYTFISLNTCWYGIGGIVSLNGNATLSNSSAAGTGVLVGLRLQPNGRDVQSARAGIEIASGASLILNGSYVIGALITTETAQETARTHMYNDGTITVAGSKNIGIDFGIYDGFYPYVDVRAGVINVTGTDDYGIRIQNMSGYTPYYNAGGFNYRLYYDNVTISNGNITLTGNNSVGMSFAQRVGAAAATNIISGVSNMVITVGGNNNVGILKSSSFETSHTNDLIVDGSVINGNGLTFQAGATNGVLLRTDKFKSVLDMSITTSGGTSGNTALQTTNGSTLEFKSGNTLTVTGNATTFTGILASGAGSVAENDGNILVTATNSSGVAAMNGGKVETTGNITMNGNYNSGIYNDAAATMSGNITVSGEQATGIFNKSTSTSLSVSGSAISASGKSAAGIINEATTGASLSGGSITATGASAGLATGIYNSGTLNPSNVAITAGNYGVGVYNTGNMNITGGSLTLAASNAVGIYAKAGSLTLPAWALNAAGTSDTILVYEGGTLTIPGGATFTVSGNFGTGLYNKGTALTTTPAISLSGANSTGVYNAVGGTLTTTGAISTVTGNTDIVGIYNEGTLTSSSNITIQNGKSVGIYNAGTINAISGTIDVEGTSGNLTIGIYNDAGKTISAVNGNIVARDYATAIFNLGNMTVNGTAVITAGGTSYSTGIFNQGAGNLTLNGALTINVDGTNGTGIYNDSTNGVTMTNGTVNVTGTSNKSAGLYHIGTGTFSFGGTAGIVATGEEDAGVFNVGTSTGVFSMTGGTITATGINGKGSVGIYNEENPITSDLPTLNVSGGTITALNKSSTGIYNEGTVNLSGGSITTVGESTTGLYNNGAATVVNVSGGSISTQGYLASAVYDSKGTINYTGNNTITATQGATGLYIEAGTVTTSGGTTTINVNNTLASPTPGAGEGVGVFASDDGTDGSNVDLSGSNITVVGGSSAVASYGAGPGVGTTNLDLTGATVDYDGDGFAVFSNGQYGKIDMTNAQLHLRGNSTGIEIDYSAGSNPITFNGTTIDIWSPSVILANIKDYPTAINVSALQSGISGALGPGVTINDYTSGQYTFGRIDGGILNIDANVSRSDASGPGYDYYNRFLGQRLITNVQSGISATAVLSTADATANYNNQIIGIEANSSTNAVLPTETQINLLGTSHVDAARTDAGGAGAVGLYVNYGKADIASGAAVNVQQGYNTVTGGVGVFGVNGSITDNAGTIKVSGPNSIGILAKGYRTAGGVNNVGEEFGSAAADQGKITITNSGTITMDSAASIGIYADNNTNDAALPSGTAVRTAADNIVTNTSTGTITVAGGTSSSNMSLGLAGSGVTLKNSGTITVGDYGVGIYGSNGTVIDAASGGSLGTIKVGGQSVAIMGTGSTIASTVTSVTLLSDNTTQDKIGIMYNGTPANINFAIDGSGFQKGTVIYLKDPGAAFTYGSSGIVLKVGANGVGVYLSESVAPGTASAINAGTIELSAGSTAAVGMYSDGGTIQNSGTIEIKDNSGQTGIFASGANAVADNTGTISLLADKGTGIYLENGATLINAGTVNFGTSAQGIGILLDGASAGVGGLSIAADNSKQNILIYAKDKGGAASTVTNGSTITVDGNVLPGTGSNKTIGVYLKRNSVQNIYTGGAMSVLRGALGIYSAGDNLIQNATINAAGKGTVGVYIDGASELANDTITASGAVTGESVIGVYAAGGVVTITGGLNLVTGTSTDFGTGMVLTGGATVTGAPITITNNSSATNVGLYYTGTSGSLAQGTDLSLAGGNLVGIYADGGLGITNANMITYASGSGLIGAYVSGGSGYSSASTGDNVGTANSAGILAGNGSAVNTGTLTVSNSSSAAMAALAKLTTETAKITNDTGATLQVTGGTGLLIGDAGGAYLGTSLGENKGTINAAAGTTGVVLAGTHSAFDGTGGTLAASGSSAVGIYLEKTGTGQVTALGNLSLGASDAIGVYADQSAVDFNVNLGGATQGIGLFARGSSSDPTVISGTVDASASTGTIGVFMDNDFVSFSGATVKSGNVGIYINKTIPLYTLTGVTVDAASAGVVGVYVDAASATPTNLLYNATTNVQGGGIGFYVPSFATLDTTGGVININGSSSVGILLDGGTGNLGVAGNLTINFGALGGMGVLVKNNGTLNIGPNLTITGSGSLAAVENASLSNGGTITVNGSTALLGNFTSGGPYTLENLASGTIHVTGGGVGIAALGTPGAATVAVKNAGAIDAAGKDTSGNSSVGIYSTTASIDNSGTITVGADGIGIYANNTNNTVANSGHIALTGTGAIGIIIGGATAGLTNGYTSIDGGDGTIGLYLLSATGTADAGRITLGDDSVGIYADGGNVSLTGGAITVGDKTGDSPLGIFAINGATLTLSPGVTVTGGDGVIAIGADGSVISGVDPADIHIAPGGVQLYTANGGTINTSGSGVLTANDNVGLMINGSGSITGVTSIDVYNGGIGAYFIGSTAAVPVINLYDGVGGANPKYSIGVYLSGVGGTVTLPTVNQIGSYTIGVVAEEGTTASIGAVNLAGTADHQIGLVSKGTTTQPNNITIASITAGGSENIGAYGEETAFTIGAVTVGDSPASSDKSTSTIGVYAAGGSVSAGQVTAGKNSIGVYGDSIGSAGISTLDVTADEGGIGIYATGTGSENITVTGDVKAAKNESMGVYGKDVNIAVTGDVSVKEGVSVGIVSEGSGNVDLHGNLEVGVTGASTGSIGIYKSGTSGVVTTHANPSGTPYILDVKDKSYAYYIEEEGGGAITVNNDADISLGKSAVGFYGKGNVTLNNNGVLQVGETDLGPSGSHTKTDEHQNSVGFYVTEGAQAYNYGTIISDKDHSVAAYVSTASYFENLGTIEVNNGGVGILAKRDPDSTNPLGGVAVNNGIINARSTASDCGVNNIAMAAYNGASVENGPSGIINVWNGVALYAGNGGTISNNGTINLYAATATGVAGNGTLVNTGSINVIGGGTANDMSAGGGTVEEGSILIDAGGIQINHNYVTVGGALRSDVPIVLNGPYVDIVNFGSVTMPLFTAPSVTGVINLTPNFAKLGNGYAYIVDNFIQALEDSNVSKVTIETSPMFIAKEADGKLYVAKKPYSELMAPGIIGLTEKSQFNELYDGLDSILYGSDPSEPNADADMLKGLNGYLESVYATSDTLTFNNEAARTIAETRGDIYGTIATRMQHVKAAFDQGFEDLFNSYNVSKDSSKYAVIYRQGSFKDDTLGVDDYDYRVQGLLYMKEYEGRNYGNKWGWTLGFGVSRFDFDDAPRLHDKSKEDVYSVRLGAHFVKNFNNEDSLRWISRGEIGYNRHIAQRSLELGDINENYEAFEKTYKNKGSYDSWQFRLDNKLEKTVYRSLNSKIDIWAGVNLEYGMIGKFSEKGDGLELEVKGRDYFSVRPEAGISAIKRVYLGKKISAKIAGKLSYAHELGNFYNENRARVLDGNAGWYELIRPEKEKGIIKAGVGVTFEKANKLGITFDVEAGKHTNKEDLDYSVGVKVKYVF
jgi:hypothetical protein